MELHAAATIAATAPEHWRFAPLPQAPLYELDAAGLRGIDTSLRIVPEAALGAALRAATAGDIVLAQASDGAVWRLQRLSQAAALWRVQALSDSRRASFLALRNLASARLVAQVLHELRNPMNALSLHSDLLGRLLQPGAAAPERAATSLKAIRDRLNDLGTRQNHAVQLWLAAADAVDESPIALTGLVDEILRLLRGLFVLSEIRLRGEALELLDAAAPLRSSAALRLAVIALLLSAHDGACRSAEAAAHEVRVRAHDERSHVRLGVEAPLGLLLAPDEAAQLALLLGTERIGVEVESPQSVVLRLPRR